MRARLLLAAAAALIFVLAVLNLAAERLHWQRGELLHPRAELFHQTQLRAESGTVVHTAPPLQHRLTAAGASGPAEYVCGSSNWTRALHSDLVHIVLGMVLCGRLVYRTGIPCLTLRV